MVQMMFGRYLPSNAHPLFSPDRRLGDEGEVEQIRKVQVA